MWENSEPSVSFNDQSESVDFFASLKSNENQQSTILEGKNRLAAYLAVPKRRWNLLTVAAFILFLGILCVVMGLQYSSNKNNTSALVNEIQVLKTSLQEMKINFDTLQSSVQNYSDAFGENDSALDTLSFAVNKNQNEIDDIRNRTVQVENKIEYHQDVIMRLVTKLECGGIIKIALVQNSLLEFIVKEESSNINQRCLWTFQNTVNTVRSNLKLSLTLISYNFSNNDSGLFAINWTRDASPNYMSHKLTYHTYEITGEQTFLSFSSENGTAGGRFLLAVSVLQTTPNNFGSHWFYGTSPGNHVVSTYKDWDQISIVVNPGSQIRFMVNTINTEQSHDRLAIYEIKANGIIIEHAKLSGSWNAPFSFVTNNPVLSMFSSDQSQIVQGFTISWA